MGGLKKGKSDPYVKINIGGVKFKSHVIKENLNPTWNEMYEVWRYSVAIFGMSLSEPSILSNRIWNKAKVSILQFICH